MRTEVRDRPAPGFRGPSLEQMVARWVDSGVISAAQGEQILGLERGRVERRAVERRGEAELAGQPPAAEPVTTQSLVVEALAYVGGVIVLAAAGWTVARLWASLGISVRLGLIAAVAALLLGAGLAVPPRLGAAAGRLRSVLWLLASGAFAGFMVLLGANPLALSDQHVALLAAPTTAGLTAALWHRHRAPLQCMGFLAAAIATVATLAAQLPGGPGELPGLAITGAALAWLALAWGGVLPYGILNTVLGGGVAIVGALTTEGTDWGIGLTLGVLAVVLATAVAARSLPLLGVGAIGALSTLPNILGRFFPSSLAAPLVLVGVGLLMVAAAVYVARRGRTKRAIPGRVREASRTAGIAAAALTAVGFAAAVIVMGV